MNPKPELIQAIVEWFRAVADENRVRILMHLNQGECNVSTLVEELEIGQASVSKHLSVLRQAKIVEVRREGTQAFYSIRGEVPLQICSLICKDVTEESKRLAKAYRTSNWEI
ncbi:MAG: ArsR/SmtB family transcription factor [Sumerlaeia bacterium]